MRQFETGATRDTTDGKIQYEGYLSPLVLQEYGRYMVRHQVQADGAVRPADNWQKGIPLDAYMDSAWRHFMDMWSLHRNLPPSTEGATMAEATCALLFNVMGYMHEALKDECACG